MIQPMKSIKIINKFLYHIKRLESKIHTFAYNWYEPIIRRKEISNIQSNNKGTKHRSSKILYIYVKNVIINPKRYSNFKC